jgi:Uma2 family endonuclease
MNACHRLRMSPEDFLGWEAQQERRHELVGGVVRLMAGATKRHYAIVRNVTRALESRLAGKPCEAFSTEIKVLIPNGNYRYPDVVVDCGTQRDDDTFADQPTVILEVSSPSTDWFDQTDKLDEYRSIPSVRHVVLLSHKRAYGAVWTRAGDRWEKQELDSEAAVLTFAALDVAVPLTEVYAGVAFPSGDEEQG